MREEIILKMLDEQSKKLDQILIKADFSDFIKEQRIANEQILAIIKHIDENKFTCK